MFSSARTMSHLRTVLLRRQPFVEPRAIDEPIGLRVAADEAGRK